MASSYLALGKICVVITTCATSAMASSPMDDFNEAIRLDLEGNSQAAFSSYSQAARTGLPQAQFNVAIMLDSGRGVSRDIYSAALWYARAAAHGDRRAAYNLGQLYEIGDGVPQNPQLARAWFASSGLAAATKRLSFEREMVQDDVAVFSVPVPIFPSADSKPYLESGGIVLIWSCKPQPTPVSYYVELFVC